MSALDDLEKLSNYGDPRSVPQCESLISKYDIPIQHFEFDYIEKCQNGKELERILQVLKSGEEGYYPELMKCAEDRLRLIKPKSKYLRQSCPVLSKNDLKEEEVKEISKDLKEFVMTATKRDNELESRKSKNNVCKIEIRKCIKQSEEETKKNEKRISSSDYNAWDKYDPDMELLKMELDEEKTKIEALAQIEKRAKEEEEKEKEEKKEEKEENESNKSVTFNRYKTEAEAIFFSEREREKGNEFFKIGDFQEALECYSHSVHSKPTVNNLNNRAVTYLKLKNYEKALRDCNKVLGLNKENVKANMRKTEALEKLERFDEALETVEIVIRIDPNNAAAQVMADRIRKKCCKELKNTRMQIIEIEE